MIKYEKSRIESINSPENLFITVRRRNYFRLSYLILQSSGTSASVTAYRVSRRALHYLSLLTTFYPS